LTNISIKKEAELVIKGRRQGRKRHTASSSTTAPTSGLNPPRDENNLPKRSFGNYPFQVCTGTWATFLILVAMSIIIYLEATV
jgi:hypothetical protein